MLRDILCNFSIMMISHAMYARQREKREIDVSRLRQTVKISKLLCLEVLLHCLKGPAVIAVEIWIWLKKE